MYIILLTIVLINSVFANNLCELNDAKCMTDASNALFSHFIQGVDNVVETSEPLIVDELKADLPTVKYELRNAVMEGMKNCKVENTVVNKANSTWELTIHCPHLETNGKYKMSGKVLDLHVEGDGDLKLIYDDCIITLVGVPKIIIGKDNKEHLQIVSFTADSDVRGNVESTMTNLFGDDKEKGDSLNKYHNDNWKEVNILLRKPFIQAFMDKFISHANTYMAYMPIDELFVQQK